MIPLRLRLRGLHSFREEQVLDFEELLGHGVFGIFGPTGSGKSTVLDAVTLALYGRVERAHRGTQGICNQDEERLEVDFTFGLAGPDGVHRYRAERSYARARGDPDALRTAKCRLAALRSDGTWEILAEKEGEFTRAVEEVLGLTAEDFTRAVVLPQGRFADFLRLNGVDRRRMLQRLFDLERYGDALSARVKARLESADAAFDRTVSELTGLGDASALALEQATASLAAAEAGAAAAAVGLQQARARHAEAERVWTWQAEFATVEEQRARLAADDPAVAAAAAEVHAAERAERVRPLLEAAAEARTALLAAGERWGAATGALTATGAAAGTARAALVAARAGRQEREGPLQERRSRLAEAVRTEAALSGVESAMAAARQAQVAAEAARDALRGRQEQAEAERDAARGAQQEAHRRLLEVRVEAEERRAVEAAVTALRDLRRTAGARGQADRSLAALEVEAGAREAAAAQAEEASLRATQAHAAAEQDRARLGEAPPGGDPSEWRQAAAGASQALEAFLRRSAEAAAAEGRRRAAGRTAVAAEAELRAAGAALEQARAAAAAERDRGLASTLAAGLVEGEPCPVCGSPHHPAPASQANAGSTAGLAGAEAAVRVAEAAATRAGGDRAAAEATLAAEDRACAAAAAALAEARAAWARAMRAFPRDFPAAPGAGMAQVVMLAVAEAQGRTRAAGEWAAAKAAAERLRQETLEALLSRERAAAELRTAAAGAGSARQAADLTLRQAAADEAVAAAEFQRACGGRGEAEIEAARREIERRDTEGGTLMRRSTQLAEAAEAAERAAEEARRALEATGAEVQSLAGEVRDLERDAERMRAELTRAKDGESAPAAELLAAAESGLRSLAAAEARAQAAVEAAEAALGAARAEAAAAGAAHDGALAAAQQTSARLAEGLGAAGLAGEAEARAAFRPEATLAALRARIAAHEAEGVRLTAEGRRLAGLLAGRALSAQEWEAAERGLHEAEGAAGAAQEAVGVARQALQAVRQRHERWLELEALRQELEGRRGTLTDLQSVLRGGAFVEFIAEEQLRAAALDASARLGQLTNFRYALEVDAQGGFCIRDDWHGGVRRPVSTLSGGETFLTSLALALALSAQIQLRGRHPLQFFFLDEGFGTLDPEALDTAMAALEHLQAENLHIGVISHVPEVRARLARRVIVDPARPGGPGSRLRIELA